MITLYDLANDRKFSKEISDCSKISKRIESGFSVYAQDYSLKKFIINGAVKGDPVSILSGKAPSRKEYPGGILGDMTFDGPKKGYYLPEKGHSLLDVHFHPENSLLFPSREDIEYALSLLERNCYKLVGKTLKEKRSKPLQVIQPISLVGLNKEGGLSLFVYQPLLKNIKKIFGSFDDILIDGFIDEYYGMLGKEASNKDIIDYFNSHSFKAKIVKGISGLGKLKDFEFLTENEYTPKEIDKLLDLPSSDKETDKKLKEGEKAIKNQEIEEFFEEKDKEFLADMGVPTKENSSIDGIVNSENGPDEE